MSTLTLPTDTNLLTRSQAYCEQVTRTSARNFYYGLKLLPKPKRAAMFALYAYMRHIDDIADELDGRTHDQRLADLESCRSQTHAALAPSSLPPFTPSSDASLLWPAFADMAQRYRIPPHLFDDAIAGQAEDLEPIAFQTFDQLREYCYRVASTVGLASIHIWGFEGGAATEALAIDRGIAFQLTNILRDLREDFSRGRVYLPREELSAMGITEQTLRDGHSSPKFLEMMRFQIERAESFYQSSADLESRIERDSRASLTAMTRIYHGILKKISADPQRVLHERVSLSVFSKLKIGWHAMRDR